MKLIERGKLPLIDAFRNNKLEFGFKLSQLRQAFQMFKFIQVVDA